MFVNRKVLAAGAAAAEKAALEAAVAEQLVKQAKHQPSELHLFD